MIDLVQTYSKHFLQNYCVEHSTSKIRTGHNTGQKLGNLMSKRPEIRYLTTATSGIKIRATEKEKSPFDWSPVQTRFF
jgi:hypothetical protein